MQNDTKLRSKISELTTNTIPTKHNKSIEGLKSQFNHSIVLISNPNIIDTTEDCFLYVMKNILGKDDYRKLKEGVQKINNFNELINKDFLSLHEEFNNNDRVVVYFDGNGVTHFGLIDGEKVKSKWGSGLIWEHSLFEVPITYGNTVKFSDGLIDWNILNNV
jgi:hypothetical protein